MMNINRCNSHGHHGSKRRELAQHAHSSGSHAFTHTLTSTVTTTLCKAPAQLLQNLESHFYFESTWGRGTKPEYPEKIPWDSLPVNMYYILLEDNIQCTGWESNPHPPILVISSLGQEHAPRLTHWATDRRCFTPSQTWGAYQGDTNVFFFKQGRNQIYYLHHSVPKLTHSFESYNQIDHWLVS